MNYFSPVTMRRLIAPQHKLSCSWFLWRRLKVKLRERGHHCSRESGAFLLGHSEGGNVRIVDFVLYDDLDPYALDSGIAPPRRGSPARTGVSSMRKPASKAKRFWFHRRRWPSPSPSAGRVSVPAGNWAME